MGRFNPFEEVFDHDTKYSHARTLRTNLWRKLQAAFIVFAGRSIHRGNRYPSHYGLLDFPLLFIQPLFDLIIKKSGEANNKSQSKLANGFRFALIMVPVALVSLALYAVRYVAATVLTIIASPIVAIVQLFSWAFSRKYKNTINAIQVSKAAENSSGMDAVVPLSQFVGKRNNLTSMNVNLSGTTAELIVNMKINDKDAGDTVETILRPDESPADKKALKALLNLNVGSNNLYGQWKAIKAGAVDTLDFDIAEVETDPLLGPDF